MTKPEEIHYEKKIPRRSLSGLTRHPRLFNADKIASPSVVEKVLVEPPVTISNLTPAMIQDALPTP